MSKYITKEEAQEIALRSYARLWKSGKMPLIDFRFDSEVVMAILDEYFDAGCGTRTVIKMLNMVREQPIRSKR